MTVFNFGSINIDHVYRVPHLVQPGETLQSQSLDSVLGGKGANQSVALARAGAPVAHLGRLGQIDGWALDHLLGAGVDTARVQMQPGPSGHAIIQVDDHGENSIVLHGGANHGFDRAWLEQALAQANSGDWLLMQNECDALDAAFDIAVKKGLQVAFNPAPMTPAVLQLPLQRCALLIVNEIEARQLAADGQSRRHGDDGFNAGASHEQTDLEALARGLVQRLPDTLIVLTLGSRGALMVGAGLLESAPALSVPVIDTTGAGDTFVGFFLAARLAGHTPQACLQRACAASAVSVTRAGATPAIPTAAELDAWLAERAEGVR